MPFDGCGDSAVDLAVIGICIVFCGDTFAADQFDLNEAHRIDVWISQADGACKDGVRLHEFCLSGDGEDHALGAFELSFEFAEDTFA